MDPAEESSTDSAYGRLTNLERFRPLHPAMLEIIRQLEEQFEVDRAEGYGLDEELVRGLDRADFGLARPDVKLIPSSPDAAPIVVTFTAFPGLYVRFGRWYTEAFPSCGCDACDESAEYEIEQLEERVDDVTAGRFREAIRRPLLSLTGSGWNETKFWSGRLTAEDIQGCLKARLVLIVVAPARCLEVVADWT